MKRYAYQGLFALCISLVQANPLSSALQRRDPSPEASHDRGTFTLDCTKAKSACSNACYWVNCLKRENKFYYDPGANNDEHRKASGCAFRDSQSVCNVKPFSQKFKDPQNLQSPSCDEFPMADFKQKKYEDRDEEDINALRCMEQGENSSAGSQYNAFKSLTGNYPKRKGTNPFVDGDYFSIDFDNDDGLGFCQSQCKNDGYQFYMSAQRGYVNPAYNYDTDNRYAMSGTQSDEFDYTNKDVAECRIHVTRTKKEAPFDPLNNLNSKPVLEVNAQVFNYRDEKKGDKTESDMKADGSLVVEGLDAWITLKGFTGGVNDPIEYKKADRPVELGWKTDTDAYCKVDDGGNDEQQVENCWFPCLVS